MSNMRFTENLKKRFIFLLTVLVLLQVVPIGAIAQNAAWTPKAINQQSAELDWTRQSRKKNPEAATPGGQSLQPTWSRASMW